MRIIHCTIPRRTYRRGTALVEFAVILPLLLMLLVGSIEVGRGINVKNTCAEAARAGARVFSMRTTKNEADVRAMVDQIMLESGLNDYDIAFDPAPSSQIKQLDPVTVTVSIEAKDASWYPTPWFLPASSKISSSCAMPADLGEASTDDNSADANAEIGELIDDDAVAETSGGNPTELEKLVLELVKEARELREAADKLKQEAEEEMAKARGKGDKEKYYKAVDDLAAAEKLGKQATEAEQRAREALEKLTRAMSP